MMQEHSGSAPRQDNKRLADPRLVGDSLTMATRRSAFPRQQYKPVAALNADWHSEGVEPRHPGSFGYLMRAHGQQAEEK